MKKIVINNQNHKVQNNEKPRFYYIDLDYIDYLKKAEKSVR